MATHALPRPTHPYAPPKRELARATPTTMDAYTFVALTVGLAACTCVLALVLAFSTR